MLSRMLNKDTGEETVLIEKTEYDLLNATIKDLEEMLSQREAFYRMADYELNLYQASFLCRIALSLTLFFKAILGREI